jgi:hypothetical protein
MKPWDKFAIAFLAGLLVLANISMGQEGPDKDAGETVAKPRKKDGGSAPDSEQPKIPSRLSKKDKEVPENLPSFKSDVSVVTVDVAVLDNKGHFIPNIPRGNFRILEDNVPQQLSGFNMVSAVLDRNLVSDPHGLVRVHRNAQAGRLCRRRGVRHAFGNP